MDPLDLIVEQSHHSETEEIEHWCPVCDRLILPSRKLVGPIQSSRATATQALDNETKVSAQASPFINEVPTPTTPTSTQRSSPVFSRRKSAQGNVRSGRPMLHRSRTSMLNATTGLHHKRKLDQAANRSNPNFLQDFLLSTHGAGAAPRTKTSPIENTSHLVNTKVEEDPPREPEHVLRTSDRPADSDPAMAQMKRKPSVPDVNAGPRLKPLTRSKLSSKQRPKSLNLITTQIVESKDVVTSATSETLVPSETPTAYDSPAETHPRYKVEDLRRRLYCSEGCYNIDLRGEKLDAYGTPSPLCDSPISGTPPTSPFKPHEVKRNLSCEMPWLWTNAIPRNTLSRRMAPTRNPSWLASGEEDTSSSDHNNIPSASEEVSPRQPFPQIKTGPLGVPTRKVVQERKQSTPLPPREVNALRKMTPASNGERSSDGSSSSEFCPAETAGVPMRKARTLFEDEKNQHRLFFRRMPGKLDAAPVTMPPLFVVDGHWTETPPPGFDYTGFMENREKERRKRQIEITDAMLLKKNAETVGVPDEVTRRHHELGRRKKRVDADKSQCERRARTMHGNGYFDDLQPGRHRQPWWHIDEREDWKTYWAARDAGLEDVTFEQWQLERHAERVERAEREQALKRIEGDRRRVQAEVVGVRMAGDGRKVAKRPLLIRVASQPTVSDVDLVGKLYKEGETRMKQHKERTASFLAARHGSSSSEASPLGMNRTKALPVLDRSVHSNAEPEHVATSPSFMRGNTLCISGFVVESPKKSIETVLSPKAAGFVFPLVGVPGGVESPAGTFLVPVETVLNTVEPTSPSLRVPPGLALPTSSLTSPVPQSPVVNPPGLAHSNTLRARPQLKKANTPPVDPADSQPTVHNDTPSHLSPRRRIQSLKNVTLTSSDSPKGEGDDHRRSSLIIPRSPLGLHSFSAAEIQLPLPEISGTAEVSTSAGGQGATLPVSRSSATRNKQPDMPTGNGTGSRRRTLPPLVINETATASMTSACAYNSVRSLSLAQQGLPADGAMGSPGVVTAVSGIGSGSGSSGEESTWSRADVRLKRNDTIKVTSTKTFPRIARGLALTQIRPKSMGPLELSEPAKVQVLAASTDVESSKEAIVGSPLSLHLFYSDFRGGSVPNGAKPPITTTTSTLTSTTTNTTTGDAEPNRQVGKRRGLWGIFGSVKP